MQWSPSLAPADLVNALTPSIRAADNAFRTIPLGTPEALQNDDAIISPASQLSGDFLPAQSTTLPNATPVGYRLPRPWPGTGGLWPTPTGPFEAWGEHFIKSNQEGIRRLRAFSRTARERAEKECWRRHDEEMRECRERFPDLVHKDHYRGCMDTALQRRGKCLENGYPNGPGELPKWGDEQEDVWINPDR
jgi:hypothetical protein